VVLLDVHLRGGPELIEKVHMRHPRVRFLWMSILDTAELCVGKLARRFTTHEIARETCTPVATVVAHLSAIVDKRRLV
jgi:hypothetical protein